MDYTDTDASLITHYCEGSLLTTNVIINKDTFKSQITESGVYKFIFDGENWTLNEEIIEDLSAYGIIITKNNFIPKKDDLIKITYEHYFIYLKTSELTWYICDKKDSDNRKRKIIIYYPHPNKYIWGFLDNYLESRLSLNN